MPDSNAPRTGLFGFDTCPLDRSNPSGSALQPDVTRIFCDSGDEHRFFMGGMLHTAEEIERTITGAQDHEQATQDLSALAALIIKACRAGH